MRIRSKTKGSRAKDIEQWDGGALASLLSEMGVESVTVVRAGVATTYVRLPYDDDVEET